MWQAVKPFSAERSEKRKARREGGRAERLVNNTQDEMRHKVRRFRRLHTDVHGRQFFAARQPSRRRQLTTPSGPVLFVFWNFGADVIGWQADLQHYLTTVACGSLRRSQTCGNPLAWSEKKRCRSGEILV